jgi:hypothetical protein
MTDPSKQKPIKEQRDKAYHLLTRQLNPSEVEELKKDLSQTLKQAKGRSRHLKKYENRLEKYREPFTTITGNGN